MQDLGNTQFFKVEVEPETGVKVILSAVFEALSEKGYNPVNQIVGYIMSGDPTYITSYKNARSLIMKVERDELVEELFKEYIKNNHWVYLSTAVTVQQIYCGCCEITCQVIRIPDFVHLYRASAMLNVAEWKKLCV